MKIMKSYNVLVAIQMLTICTATGCWSKQAFFQRKEGQYLADSVIQSKQGLSEIECGLFCMRESGCASVNYKRSGENQGVCELNNRTLENSPENAFENPEFVNLVIIDLEGKTTQDLDDKVTKQQFLDGLYNSSILKGKYDYVKNLTTWLNGENNWTICYRATQHGWNGTTFHSFCDNKGPTVTIVRVGVFIFGGYSDISWDGRRKRDEASTECFLFSLKNNDNLAPFKLPVVKSSSAIYNYLDLGPIFGGNDLVIFLNDDDKSSSYSNLGDSYQLPAGYTYDNTKAKSLLAGSRRFTPNEVELFYLDK